tara:strand:+ start:418 stop:933 length:516 start_codon:yes stop_codon:yes gene_type:complete
MTDYSKSKIYKIVCNTTGLVYYGSTVQTLKRRLNGHKTDIKRGKTCSSKLVLENNNFEIILVENFPCETRKELLRREGEHQVTSDCVNNNIAGRSREEIKRKKKEHYHRNKEKYNQQSKEHYHRNKEKCNQQSKEYYEKNKEKQREYYQRNKDEITRKLREKYHLNKNKNK